MNKFFQKDKCSRENTDSAFYNNSLGCIPYGCVQEESICDFANTGTNTFFSTVNSKDE